MTLLLCRKLIAQIDEEIQLAANKDYTPTQHKWVTDDEGKQTKVEVAKRVKRWWTASANGKIKLVVRYGSKPLEFTKGKNAIELASEAQVADTLGKVREGAKTGELIAWVIYILFAVILNLCLKLGDKKNLKKKIQNFSL